MSFDQVVDPLPKNGHVERVGRVGEDGWAATALLLHGFGQAFLDLAKQERAA